MIESSPTGDRATYEIRVQGEIPASLLQRYPALAIHRVSAETVLHRVLDDLVDLDRLLEQLQALGLVLCELRETPVPGSDTPTAPGPTTSTTAGSSLERLESPVMPRRSYEVRIDNRPGETLLRSIPWAHRFPVRQSVVRVRAGAPGLTEFLSCCAANDLMIERITRLAGSADRDRSGRSLTKKSSSSQGRALL